jgi:hypothetical protein
MAKERDDIQLIFNMELESKKVLRGLADVDKAVKNAVSRKLELKWDVAGFKALRGELDKSRKGVKEMAEAIRTVGGKKQFRNVEKEFEAVEKASNNLKSVVSENFKSMAKIQRALSVATTKAQKEALTKQMKMERDRASVQVAQAKRVLRGKESSLKERLTKTPGYSEIFEKHGERNAKRGAKAESQARAVKDLKGRAVGREMALGLKDAMEKISGKDFLGAGKAGARIAGELIKGMGKGSIHLGRAMSIKGAGGGAGAGAMSKAGGALQSIGPLISSLSKLGGILTGFIGGFATFFKLLMDVESVAKDMNKALLEGASSIEFLNRGAGDVNDAFARMDKLTTDIQDQAMNTWENLKFGTTKDQVIQVTNALAQQGVPLAGLQKGFENLAHSTNQAGFEVKNYGDLARMSIAYSKLLGVSLQEIGDFEAQMMTDMGQSVTGVKLEFTRMAREAADSGIAANKFFSILRGVSSDLSLYNTRIGQAATLLKTLGKAMSPREAQKFMQFATQGLSQMDLMQRTRLTLVAGTENTRARNTKDAGRKQDAVAAEIYGSLGEDLGVIRQAMAGYMKGDGEKLYELLERLPEEQRGAIQETMTQVRRMVGQNQGGAVGVAEASGYLSAGAMLEQYQAVAEGLLHTKKDIGTFSDKELLAFQNVSGVSGEVIKQLASMREGVELQRRDIVKAFRGELAGTGYDQKERESNTKLQKDIRNRLKVANVISEDQIKKMGTADLLAISEATKKELEDDGKTQIELAQKQATLTVSIADKMDVIKDGIFNYLYRALREIIDLINRVMIGLNLKDKGAGGMLDSARSNSNFGLIDKLKDSTKGVEDDQQAKKAVITVLEKAVGKTFASGKVNSKDAIADLYKLLPRDQKGLSTLGDMLKGGVSDDKRSKLIQSLKSQPLGSFNIGNALKDSGFDQEDIGKLYQKALYISMRDDPQSAIDMLTNLSVTKQSVGNIANTGLPTVEEAAARASEASSTSSPTGQTAATTASQSPGVPTATPVSKYLPGQPAPSSGSATVDEYTDFVGKETVNGFQDLYDALRRNGVKLDKAQLNSDVKRVIKEGVLEGAREALFEYAVYSSQDPNAMLERMRGSNFGGVSSLATAQLGANASGGRVVGIAGGRAVIASPGEGLASVGRGEKIVPAGGGGGGVVVNVNGIGGADLANYLRAKIAEGIYEYKRKEKFQ